MLRFDHSSEAYQKAVKGVMAKLFPDRPQSTRLDSRQEFYLQLLAENGLLRPGTRIVDLGGGASNFTAVLSRMGLEASLVDDFGGGGGVDTRDLAWLDVYRELGVKVYSQDLLSQPLPFPAESVDVLTCFHSLEHWHHSPRRLFAEIQRILRPEGYIVLATPNAVNLRKRIYAVVGLNPAPDLMTWYKGDVYRGHVREPSVADLHRLLDMNGFRALSTYGRNFIGQESHALSFLPRKVRWTLARGSQGVLAFFPSLCSDIHVVGQKRGAPSNASGQRATVPH